MYEQFWLTVFPQVDSVNVQHTPKPKKHVSICSRKLCLRQWFYHLPAAQFPSAFPDLSVHSVELKQVPKTSTVEVDEAPVHCLKDLDCEGSSRRTFGDCTYLLGKVTTEKRERTSEK